MTKIKMTPETFKFKGHVIKAPSFRDLVYMNEPVKTKGKWFGLVKAKVREPDTFDMIERLRDYILNNSNPILDVNDITPEYTNELFGMLVIYVDKDYKPPNKARRTKKQ